MTNYTPEHSQDYEEYRKKFKYLVICKSCIRSADCKDIPDACRFCGSQNIIVKDRSGKEVHKEKEQFSKQIAHPHKPLLKKKPRKKRSSFIVIDAIKINEKIYEIRKTATGVYTYNATDKTMTGTVRIKPRMKDAISIEEITEKQVKKMKKKRAA